MAGRAPGGKTVLHAPVFPVLLNPLSCSALNGRSWPFPSFIRECLLAVLLQPHGQEQFHGQTGKPKQEEAHNGGGAVRPSRDQESAAHGHDHAKNENRTEGSLHKRSLASRFGKNLLLGGCF